MTTKSLAIIGGGASAVLLLAHIARYESGADLSIDMYDRSGAFGRGIAYSTPHLCHLLNVRASNMSALADTPDDFTRWAATHGYGSTDFVPRKLYGDYLTTHLDMARQKLTVNFVPQDALSVRQGDHYLVNGEHYDMVVQATGNCSPMRPRLDGDVAGYHDNPWSVDYASLAQSETVALVGSGLSAVDAILALDAHDYAGRIIVISRRSLFPADHIQASAYPPFIKELPATALEALRLVRDEIKHSNAPWQTIIDSIRPFTNPIWQSWSEVEQKRFMKRLFTYWNIHRHRMAPQIAQTLNALESAGRVIRHRASVLSVASGPMILTDDGVIKADAVVNCLGYRYHERPIDASHKIGPARFGPLFETTAIPEIRAQAAEIAAEICF